MPAGEKGNANVDYICIDRVKGEVPCDEFVENPDDPTQSGKAFDPRAAKSSQCADEDDPTACSELTNPVPTSAENNKGSDDICMDEDAKGNMVVVPCELPKDIEAQADALIGKRIPETLEDAQRGNRATEGASIDRGLDPDVADALDNARPQVGPHYFHEDTDTVYFPDFVIYICGADVTPYVKGSLSVTKSVGSSPNVAKFTLDNSNNRFTLTPENVIRNEFHIGADSSRFAEYDQSAKALIYLYKNNQLVNPENGAPMLVNNPPDDVSGRRLPLNIHSTVFHRMDPIRIWVRTGPFDEWIPEFTGYLINHPMEDDWVTHASTVQITAHDIRDPMRRMRVQQNTVFFNLPGKELTSDSRAFTSSTLARSYKTQKPGVPNKNNPTGNTGVTDSKSMAEFWGDTVRGGNAYSFAWAGLSFQQVSVFMTIGGNAPIYLSIKGVLDPATVKEIKKIEEQIKELEAELEQVQTDFKLALDLEVDTSKLSQVQEDRLTKMDWLRKQIEKLNIKADELRTKKVAKGGGSQAVKAVGRLGKGRVFRYPATSKDEDNRELLDYWYRLCLFGSPYRFDGDLGEERKPDVENRRNWWYWTFDHISNPKTGAGPRSQWDDLWAPDNQLVHWMLPGGPYKPVGLDIDQQIERDMNTKSEQDFWKQHGGSGAEDKNVTELEIIEEGNIGSSRVWTNRVELIEQFAQIVDYRWWVTGSGDIVFEFPMYDFEPVDFGPWVDPLTVDGHAISSSLDEESGDVPTVVTCVGSFTGGLVPSESNVHAYAAPPNATIVSFNLATRMGVKVDVKQFPFVQSSAKLKKLAALELQKALAFADQSSVSMGWRPWLLPNKPLHFVPRDRMALMSSVTNTMTINGECTTSAELQYTRMLDVTGLRRYITGGAHQPIAFATVPGRKESIVQLLKQRMKVNKVQVDAMFGRQQGELTPADQKQRLLDKNAGKAVVGTDRYNVINALVNTRGDGNIGYASRVMAQTEAKLDTAVGVVDDVSMNTSGATTVEDPTGPKPTPKPVNIRTRSGSSNPLDRGEAESQAQSILNDVGIGKETLNGWNALDLTYLAAVVYSETRDMPDVTEQEKVAVAHTVVNAATVSEYGKRRAPKAGALASYIQSHGNEFNSQWAGGSEEAKIASSVLSGETSDPTGGAKSIAKIDPNSSLEDSRACNVLIDEQVELESDKQTTAGDVVKQGKRFLFFKRSDPFARKSAIKKYNFQRKGLGLPWEPYMPFITAAAEETGVSEAFALAIFQTEVGDLMPKAGTEINSYMCCAGIGQLLNSYWEEVVLNAGGSIMSPENRSLAVIRRSAEILVKKGRAPNIDAVLNNPGVYGVKPNKVFYIGSSGGMGVTNVIWVSDIQEDGSLRGLFYSSKVYYYDSDRKEKAATLQDRDSIKTDSNFALVVHPKYNILKAMQIISGDMKRIPAEAASNPFAAQWDFNDRGLNAGQWYHVAYAYNIGDSQYGGGSKPIVVKDGNNTIYDCVSGGRIDIENGQKVNAASGRYLVKNGVTDYGNGGRINGVLTVAVNSGNKDSEYNASDNGRYILNHYGRNVMEIASTFKAKLDGRQEGTSNLYKECDLGVQAAQQAAAQYADLPDPTRQDAQEALNSLKKYYRGE